jgi:NADPH:quinone reductase-like Zn-dependent oxidoreductase
MRAVAWLSAGGSLASHVVELDRPEPARGQLLVRVAASALNPADLRVASGGLAGRFLHARTSPLVTGYDFSGTVEGCGPGGRRHLIGEEVFGFVPYARTSRQGAFAEYLTVDGDAVARKPASLSHELAAAAPTPTLTALQALRDRGGVKAGSRVLVIGAAGGVGSMAVGVGVKLGAQVTAVASAAAMDYVRGLGAHLVVDRRTAGPAELPGPFDVVFDTAAASDFLAFRQRLAAGGAYVTTLPSPGLLVGKVVAALTGRRCDFLVVKSVAADLELVAGWIAQGLQVPIEARFPVHHLSRAAALLAKGGRRGRLAIQVASGF